MPHRYEQVALTYLRQWQVWAYLAAAAASVMLADVLPWWWRQPMVFVFLALAATGPAGAIGFAKMQIADARAQLTPGFRAPHVLVPVLLSLGAVVLMPLLVHHAFQMPVLGLIASAAVAATAFALLAYFQSVWAVVVSMAGCGLMMIAPIREAGFAMMTGQRNGLALVALAFASALFLLIFYRLAILRESMSEYARILGDRSEYAWSNPQIARRPGTPPATVSLLLRIQLAATDKRLRVIRNVFGATLWRRVRHWMLSGEISGSKWAPALLIAGFLTGLPLIVGSAWDTHDGSIAGIGAVISVLIPVFCVTATWMSRRRSMGYELTRPVSRERFVREFGLAMATDLVDWWLWLTLAALVPLLVWGPSLRVTDVLAMIVLSGAEQVLAFGILVSVLRLRSPRASDGSILSSVIIVIAPTLMTVSLPRTPGMSLAIAAGVAGIGAALTYDAYRRWCEMDLA